MNTDSGPSADTFITTPHFDASCAAAVRAPPPDLVVVFAFSMIRPLSRIVPSRPIAARSGVNGGPGLRRRAIGLTPAAAAVFLPTRALRLARLPFRVGRIPVAGEAQPLEENDLQLSDTKPFHVSRNHFAIERVPDGVQVRDRGSYVGTIVNKVQIGGHRHVASVPLAVGENEVVAGSPSSPFRFRVVVAAPAAGVLSRS